MQTYTTYELERRKFHQLTINTQKKTQQISHHIYLLHKPMSKAIQQSIQKTVLVKWNSEKIVVNIPFDKVYDAMTTKETIKIGKEHVIRTSAINEYYGYNCTDEIEIRVTVTYPEYEQKIMAMIHDREKA